MHRGYHGMQFHYSNYIIVKQNVGGLSGHGNVTTGNSLFGTGPAEKCIDVYICCLLLPDNDNLAQINRNDALSLSLSVILSVAMRGNEREPS